MDKEQGDSVCHEKDGCPTEGAVLRREWRAQRAEIERLQNELHEVAGLMERRAARIRAWVPNVEFSGGAPLHGAASAGT